MRHAARLTTPSRQIAGASRPGCVAGGCITIILLLLVFGGILGGIFVFGNRSLKPVATEYFAAVEAGDYPKAYALLSSSRTSQLPVYRFQTDAEQMRKVLGPLRETTLNGVNFSSVNGNTTGKATFQAEYTNDKGEVIFLFEKVSGRWLIENVVYNIPAAARAVTTSAGPATTSGSLTQPVTAQSTATVTMQTTTTASLQTTPSLEARTTTSSTATDVGTSATIETTTTSSAD